MHDVAGPAQNTYDQFADEYANVIEQWAAEPFSFYHDLLIPLVLGYLGTVAGYTLLDAGCGEGHLARLLADRGARVTAIDISPRLIELARQQDPEGRVDFQVRDLS